MKNIPPALRIGISVYIYIYIYTIIRPVRKVCHRSVSHKYFYIIMYSLEINMPFHIRRNFLRSAWHPQ